MTSPPRGRRTTGVTRSRAATVRVSKTPLASLSVLFSSASAWESESCMWMSDGMQAEALMTWAQRGHSTAMGPLSRRG